MNWVEIATLITMDWFEIATVITVVIGCVLYCYGLAKEPVTAKAEDIEHFTYRKCFTDVFTDPTKKTRKIGTILIYVGSILLMLKVLLDQVI